MVSPSDLAALGHLPQQVEGGQAHHITHWANGGDTNLQNTQLLCRKHHTRTHLVDATRPPEP